ncbi:NAD(P)/FAD-dependent oxidoreductase [Candidatus Woesearchaeota archaeon]|nr:NAD(P)/FAD-dependent oxidoreductase [Candidatus Woesearchaeota archaeon]
MIAVIGAGPAGCHYASKVDADVTIFEEHKRVGYPVACTGIVTNSIYRNVSLPKDLEVSRIHTFRLVSPNGKSVDIHLDKENIVMDRAKFDQWLMEKALDNGAKLLTGHKFLGYKDGYKKDGKTVIKTSQGNFTTEMVVGADGPKSTVAKTAGLYGKRQFLSGLQARARYHGEMGVTEVHLGKGEFAWVVPEDEHVARVGVIGTKVAGAYKTLLKGCKILEDQSGIVPLYNPKQRLRKKNVFLIGDAATQVKATTYGGIIYGLVAGSYLAENPETYEKRFNEKLGKDLWISLKMRQAMNTMTTKQCDELVRIFNNESTKAIIEKHDRDFPSKFILQLLMKETKLWKLGFQILGKSLLTRKSLAPR